MKDIYKNPTFYYILVPIAVALWPLFIWAAYLPHAEDNWQAEKAQYQKAREIMDEIRELDPDRLEFANSTTDANEFGYVAAVEKVASLCGIPATNYKVSSGMITKIQGQKSQSAHVVLKDVGIKNFAKFLSTIQLAWANLQCSQVKLTQKEGLPDKWDVDLELKYYYETSLLY